MHCNVLQCVTNDSFSSTTNDKHKNHSSADTVACCSVLQCVAVCCSVLQCVAVCCSVSEDVAVCCSALQ